MNSTPPTTSLSDSELAVSYWYVTHQQLMRRALIGFLIGLASVAWIYVTWSLVDYVRYYRQERAGLYSSLVIDSTGLTQAVGDLQPIRLNISDVQAISNGKGGYNILARVTNANSDWLAEFDYRLTGESTLRQGFVLPRTTAHLTILGAPDALHDVELINQRWYRIEGAADKLDQRNTFAITDLTLTPPSGAEIEGRVDFNVTNQSAFNYWDADFVIMVYNNSGLIRVDQIRLDEFKSGESRPVSLLIGNDPATTVEVAPLVNVLSPENLMPFTGGQIIDNLDRDDDRRRRR